MLLLLLLLLLLVSSLTTLSILPNYLIFLHLLS